MFKGEIVKTRERGTLSGWFTRLTLLAFLTLVGWTGASAQSFVVSGTVTDEAGEPMIGVTVVEKGNASNGVATNADGQYQLKVQATSTLDFSYIGCYPLSVAVNDRHNIDVVMKENAQNLDEVVVVAYGTQKKSSITGAISQVGSADIDRRPVSSVTSALEGASSGISVTGVVGNPGSDPSITIRGVGSVTAGSYPLIVVDGVPYDGNISDISPDDIESMSVLKDAASCALYGNRASNGVILLTTKKSKVKKPTFTFKTTQGWYERGQSDYDRTDARQFMEVEYANMYNGYIGTQKLDRTNAADMASARQYTINNLLNRLYINIFDKPVSEMFDADGKMNGNVNILSGYQDDLDWYDQAIRKGYRSEYGVTGSGATDHSDYYFSMGYLKENGYTKNSGFERFTGRASININPRTWFKAGLQMNASHQRSNYSDGDSSSDSGSTTNPFRTYRVMAPIYPVHIHDVNTGEYLLDVDGGKQYDPGYYFETGADGKPVQINTRNQLVDLNSIYESQVNSYKRTRNTTNSIAYADIILPYGFVATVKGNLSTSNSEWNDYGSSIIGGSAKGDHGKLSKYIYNRKTWAFQQQLNWNHAYGKHHVSVLLGHENYGYSQDYTYARKKDVNVEGTVAFTNFSTITDLEGYQDNYRTESYLARAQYNFNDKYNLEGSFRRDGSSRFSKDVRWGNFGSIGANWVFTAEDFMKGQNWITNGKLRANWGQVGNDAAADYYAYYSLYEVSTKGGDPSYVLSQLGATDLKWETSESWGAAIEARLFNRWNLSVEYYDKRNKDLIFDVDNPASAGSISFGAPGSYVQMNLGSISNRGFEINTDVDVYTDKDWHINIAANLTTLKNKVTKLPSQYADGMLNGSQKIVEGKSRYEWFMYHWAGVDMMDGMSLYDANLDDYHVVGADGNIIGGTYEDGELVSTALKAADYKCIDGKYYVNNTTYAKKDFRGSALPTVYGSVTANIGWKNFNLSAMMTYSAGGKLRDGVYSSLMGTGSVQNYHVDILNSWNGVPAGMTETSAGRINPDINPVIDANYDSYNNASSDRWLTSRNYVCFKNLNISYRLPKSVLKPLTLNSAQIYFSAENLVTSTKRTGLAATQYMSGNVYNVMPNPRVYTFGLNVSF